MNTEEKIWSYLKGQGLTDAGTAGLMGNLYAESGLRANNLQNSYEGKLGMADAEYTELVDNGGYTNFAPGQAAGYGLCRVEPTGAGRRLCWPMRRPPERVSETWRCSLTS